MYWKRKLNKKRDPFYLKQASFQGYVEILIVYIITLFVPVSGEHLACCIISGIPETFIPRQVQLIIDIHG